MATREPFRISHSIHDFSPLFFDLEYLFKRLKATGIDGVEIVLGFKSRWNAKQIRILSEKYELPIVSLHQPPWSAFGIWFDEGIFDLAALLEAKTITCHPLVSFPLFHPKMQRYLARLAQLQDKKGIQVLIENFPEQWYFMHTQGTNNIEQIIDTVKKYGLKMTLDIDHLGIIAPHKEPWFSQVLPYIGNIHLSSFSKKYKHMPVYLGDFQTKDFIQSLHQADYQGLITFEFQYPRLLTFLNYDFEMIKKSVEFVKSV